MTFSPGSEAAIAFEAAIQIGSPSPAFIDITRCLQRQRRIGGVQRSNVPMREIVTGFE
jgi:hypothetical protein